MSMRTNNLPYAFIATHYRDPKCEDPVKRWLPHPEVARAICGALFANGVKPRDLEDRLQDVYVKVLAAFKEGTVPPQDLRAMKAFCAITAKNMAIDLIREAQKRKRDLAEPCPREEFALPDRQAADPNEHVDTARQLDVLAALFHEGRMPEAGVAILEGVAAGRSYAAIGRKLEISKELVKWRMNEMRRICRERMAELGMLPDMKPLRLVVCQPSAITLLKVAA